MDLLASLKSNQDRVELDFITDLQRKSNFLKPLVIGQIIILGIALLLMLLVPPISPWYWFVLVGATFAINFIVLYLHWRGFIQLAAQLFCHNFNTFIIISLLINLIVEVDIESTVLMEYILALSIILAGMLISPKAIFGYSALNISVIFFITFFLNDTLDEILSFSFPVIVFLALITIVSWLYQRTLDQSHNSLIVAQQQLLQTQLMQRDLEIARELQRRFYPAPPVIKPHLTMAARSEPARETSGDFYDFIEVTADDMGIVIADVAGKSLPAALIMTMARSTLRSEARRFGSPLRVLEQTNQILYEDTSVNQMITAFYGILNTQQMTFHFSNAGHIYPTLKRNGMVREFELPGIPLGLVPNPEYGEKIVQLEPGDQLILSSDGLIEAMNASGELFGFERFAAAIQQAASNQPHALLEEIWRAVETFRGPVEQHDDMTLVVIAVANQMALPVRTDRRQVPLKLSQDY